MNQATKKELKKLIGNYVLVLPTGSNKDRKINDKESIYSVRLIKITSINAYFEDQLVNKLKIDGSCDEKNHSGLIFSSKEDAMDYLWGIDFIKFSCILFSSSQSNSVIIDSEIIKLLLLFSKSLLL